MLTPRSELLAAALETLNPSQKTAALHQNGPAVVFAGAGSGKTRIITHRIALLIENSVPAFQILAVTFTNKAAGEMKERVNKISPYGRSVHIGTFHSACARWLREFAVHLGFTSDFVIYDDSDSRQLLRAILAEMNISKDDVGIGEYQNAINKAKTLGLLPMDCEGLARDQASFFPKGGLAVYQRYQERLAKANAMDFNDLLLNMLLLLRRNQEVRKTLSQRYRYVLVDEYQDTNPTQFALISHILSDEQNLFVVGDDDQSIYSWRGANPANILNFTSHYPGAVEIRLEENYRCTNTIVTAANAVIQNNKVRASKVLFTKNPDGTPIHYQHEYSNDSEATFVVEQVLQNKELFPLEETAIFYRTNAQSRILEDGFRRANISYQIYGALRFYDRAEIKDLMAYIRLLMNKDDDIALKRIINLPTRGIGDKAVDLIISKAVTLDCSLLDALKIALETTPAKQTGKLNQFYDLYCELKSDLKTCSLAQLVPNLTQKIHYADYLKKKYPEESQDKISNVNELAAALAEYAEENPDATLSTWLNDVSLQGSEEGQAGGVTLMTLHSAKGLEYKKVFIVGFEDGLIPHINSMDDPSSVEEERRLVYVGFTRAKESLTLVSAARRRTYNGSMANRPSRFLKEIPKNLLKLSSNTDFFSQDSEQSSQTKQWKIGQKVKHPVYGRGKICDLEQEFGIPRAIVDFPHYGWRKVLTTQLELVSFPQ